MTIEYRYLVDLPYDLKDLRAGFSPEENENADRAVHLAYLGKQLELQRVGLDYQTSFAEPKFPTMGSYRDFLISRAVYYSLVNCLYYNPKKTLVTGHAEKAFERYSFDSFYPRSNGSSVYELPSRFAGLLGTVAYYFTYVKSEGYPIDYFKELLSYIWAMHGCDFNDEPKVRVDKLLNHCQALPHLNEVVQGAFKNLFAITDPSHTHYTALLYAKKHGLSVENGENFIPNVLAGTYPTQLIQTLSLILNPLHNEQVNAFVNNVLSIAKPAGFPLLIQALIVESFIRAAEALTAIDQQTADSTAVVFFANKKLSTLPLRMAVQSRLVTAYDSTLYFYESNIRDPNTTIEDLLDISRLLDRWTPPAVGPDDPGRLPNLVDTTGERPDRPFFEEVRQIRPSGPDNVVLYPGPEINGNFIYVAINFTSPTAPKIVFLEEENRTVVDVVGETDGPIKPEDGPKIVEDLIKDPSKPIPFVPGGGGWVTIVGARPNTTIPGAPVAVTRPDVDNGSTIPPTLLPGNTTQDPSDDDQEGEKEFSNSNPLPPFGVTIIWGDGPPPIDLLDPVGDYTDYVAVADRTLPRGGNDNAYRLLYGIGGRNVTQAQFNQIAKDKRDGAFIDYAGRMCALGKDENKVHVEAEVGTVENWLNNLPIGENSIFKIEI